MASLETCLAGGRFFPAAVGSFVRQFRMGLQAEWYRSLGVLLLPSCLGRGGGE